MSVIIPDGARLVRGYAGETVGRPKSKYRNKPTMRGNIKFASKAEAQRYDQLCLLEKNGELRKLRLQVPFRLVVNGSLICRYVADFVYEELRRGIWSEVVEDRKGYATPAYRLKKKLMLAIHGIAVRET